MKSQARVKVGGRRGNPGYRTPSSFKYRQAVKIGRYKKHNFMNPVRYLYNINGGLINVWQTKYLTG